MEILEKCIFHNLNDLIQFKKYTVYDLQLVQSDENSIYFKQTDPSFKISTPRSASVAYFAHFCLDNSYNLAYQRFLLTGFNALSVSQDPSLLSLAFGTKKLVLIFDVSTTWLESLENTITDINGTLFMRISYTQMLQQEQKQENSADPLPSSDFREQFITFLDRNMTRPEDTERFLLKFGVDTREHTLLAVVVDNLTHLGVFDEPQNIELSRRQRKQGKTNDWELRLVDILRNLNAVYGCLVVTTGFEGRMMSLQGLPQC